MTTVGKDVQKLETSETVARNENGMAALKNSLAVPQDIKHSYHMTQQFHS